MSRRRAFAVPVLLAFAGLVHLYGATHSHWSVMLRPGAIAATAAVLLTASFLAIWRSPERASVATCVCVMVFIDWLGALLVIAVGTFVVAFRRIVLTRGTPATAIVAPVGLLLVTTLVAAAVSGRLSPDDFGPSALGEAVTTSAPSSRPNVYLLLLDGYPRQDTLAREFHFDNAPFIEALTGLGFTVNMEATSTFANTELTLSSMVVNERGELTDLIEQDGEAARPRHEIRRTRLVNSAVMNDLRAQGYRLAYVPPPIGFVDWSGWDERRGGGYLNDYEALILQRSPLRWLLGDWVLHQTLERHEFALDQWTAGEGQQFVFAHVMAPHPPFVWTEDGSPPHLPTCWYELDCTLYAGFPHDLEVTADEYVRMMVPQVEGLNRQVLAAVEKLVTDDPTAVIVVFSDHGTRYRGTDDPEARRTLFATRATSVTGTESLFASLLSELK